MSRLVASRLMNAGVLALASTLLLFSAPAFADNYQVTVTLTGSNSIPAAASYSFDTTNPFSSTSLDVTSAITSINWDHACGVGCSLDSVLYSRAGSVISFNQNGTLFGFGVGCVDLGNDGVCTVPAAFDTPLNITAVGTYNSSDGSIAVTDLTTTGSGGHSLPESKGYIEVLGSTLAFGLLAVGRLSPRRRVGFDSPR